MTALALTKKNADPASLRSVDALARFGIDLLQQERAAILSGAFDRLADLGDRKGALLDEIESRASAVAQDTTTLERQEQRKSLLGVATILSRRATENQNLLTSSLNGAQKARDMVERLNTGAPAGFYGATGQKIATSGTTAQTVVKL